MSLKDYSILDRISDSISPIIRRLSDVNANVSGTAVQILRVYKEIPHHFKQRSSIQPRSVLGDFKERLQTMVLSNVTIKYPFQAIEIFQSRYENFSDQSKVDGIDVIDILPIEADLRFEGSYESDPIRLQQHDKLVDVFYDEHQNPIPIILEVTKFLGDFYGKNIVSKKCQLALYRGQIPQDMKAIVDDYINNLSAQKKEIRQRRF